VNSYAEAKDIIDTANKINTSKKVGSGSFSFCGGVVMKSPKMLDRLKKTWFYFRLWTRPKEVGKRFGGYLKEFILAIGFSIGFSGEGLC